MQSRTENGSHATPYTDMPVQSLDRSSAKTILQRSFCAKVNADANLDVEHDEHNVPNLIFLLSVNFMSFVI